MNTTALKRSGAHNDEQPLEKPVHASAILQHEIIEVLLNSEQVHLSHFLPSKEDINEKHLLSARVDISDLGEPASVNLAVSLARDRMDRRNALKKWLLAAAGSLLLACSAYIIGGYASSGGDIKPAVWRVVQVTPSGVSLAISRPSGDVLTQIPIGGVLPDGQRLSGVDASRQIYSTNLHDVRLRSASKPEDKPPIE